MTRYTFTCEAPSEDDGCKVLVIIAGNRPHAMKLARRAWSAAEVRRATVKTSPETTGIVYAEPGP